MKLRYRMASMVLGLLVAALILIGNMHLSIVAPIILVVYGIIKWWPLGRPIKKFSVICSLVGFFPLLALFFIMGFGNNDWRWHIIAIGGVVLTYFVIFGSTIIRQNELDLERSQDENALML